MSRATDFLTLLIILLLYVEAHILIYGNIGKRRNLLSYNASSTNIHALISCGLDYCNSLLYNVPTHKTDRLHLGESITQL